MSNLAMRAIGLLVLTLMACLDICPAHAEMNDFPDRLDNFGFSLLERLEVSETKNFLISPASIEFALGMAWTGAAGETAQAMGRLLGINSSSREAALSELTDLRATLESPGSGITLKVANAAWIDDSVQLNKSFSTDLATTFKTKLESVRFRDSNTISRINDWVSDATGGRITRLLESRRGPPC